MQIYKAPYWLSWFYPALTWHKDRSEKCLFLTFDDGPVPDVTEEIIFILKKYGILATFFCVGENIQRYPELFDQLKTCGHRIGNHTHNHLNAWATSDDVYLKNVELCQALTQSKLFRPPYSKLRHSQIRALKSQYEIIMWDVVSRDFDPRVSPEQCLKNTLKYTQNGSIIVFHDHVKAWKNVSYTLPRALEQWLSEGYRFDVL